MVDDDTVIDQQLAEARAIDEPGFERDRGAGISLPAGRRWIGSLHRLVPEPLTAR